MCVFAVNARKYILQPNNEVQSVKWKKVSKMLQVMSVFQKNNLIGKIQKWVLKNIAGFIQKKIIT